MKRLSLALLVVILLFPAVLLAQSPADYVRNSETIPDIWNQSLGWEHDRSLDRRDSSSYGGVILFRSYFNSRQRLVAVVASVSFPSRNIDNEDVLLMYTGGGVARTALKVDGQWFVSVGPFEDNGKDVPENDVRSSLVENASGNVV